MDDIKVAITRVITNLHSPGIGQAIGRLAFMAEFPAHFSVSLAGDVFLQACSMSSTPSADDLKPLMAHPALVAAMIKERESTLRNQLQTHQPSYGWSTVHESVPAPASQMEAWLQEELRSFGFPE